MDPRERKTSRAREAGEGTNALPREAQGHNVKEIKIAPSVCLHSGPCFLGHVFSLANWSLRRAHAPCGWHGRAVI